jgi:hypothetical protein
MTGDDGENNVIPFPAKRQTTPQEIGEAIGETIIRACECDPRAKGLLRTIALAWQVASQAAARPPVRPVAATKSRRKQLNKEGCQPIPLRPA